MISEESDLPRRARIGDFPEEIYLARGTKL